MLKLVRNTLVSKGLAFDGNGGMITCIYIANLINLQERYGLHAANKLWRCHIQLYSEAMKVKLATQTLSLRVTNSLEYLCHYHKIKELESVTSTAEFLKIFNNLTFLIPKNL